MLFFPLIGLTICLALRMSTKVYTEMSTQHSLGPAYHMRALRSINESRINSTISSYDDKEERVPSFLKLRNLFKLNEGPEGGISYTLERKDQRDAKLIALLERDVFPMFNNGQLEQAESLVSSIEGYFQQDLMTIFQNLRKNTDMKKFADHMRVFIGRNMNAALLEQSPENLVEILQLKSHELYDSHNFLRFILHIESYQDPLGHPYSNKQTIDLLKANELLGVSFQQAAIFEPIKDIEGHTGRLATNL
ncbi:hypothetical protein Plhal304r1_c057g0143101 [Plasmopara halstedii]